MQQLKRQLLFVPVTAVVTVAIVGWFAWVNYIMVPGLGLLSCLVLPVVILSVPLFLGMFFDFDWNEERRQYRLTQLSLTMLFTFIFVVGAFDQATRYGREIGRKHLLQSKPAAHVLLDYHQQQNEPAPYILSPGTVSQEEVDWLDRRTSWHFEESADGWYVDFGFPSGWDQIIYRYTTTEKLAIDSCEPMNEMPLWYFCGEGWLGY